MNPTKSNPCNGCTECCWYLAVPWLKKPQCHDCTYVENSKGCGIYTTRPPECGGFECVWLQMWKRGKSWSRALRPDRCGVMFAATTEDNVLTAHTRDARMMKGVVVNGMLEHMLTQGIEVIQIIGPKRVSIRWVKS